MEKPVTVKCYLTTYRNEGIEIRRFQYKDSRSPTVQQLKDHVRKLYPQLRGEQIKLMYLDEDQEKVAITTDAELDMGWREITEGDGTRFRLYIFSGNA